MTATNTYTGWAPWHPEHGFQDEFMSATWVSTDLDEIAQRVKRLNQDDKTNNRTGWRAVKITLALSSAHQPCPGCDGHECDNGCAYPGALSSTNSPREGK